MSDNDKSASTKERKELTLEHYSVATIKEQLDEYFYRRQDNDGGLLCAISRLPSTFLLEKNNTQYRRSFRSKIQKHHIQINLNFLDAFKTLKIKVDDLCNCVDATRTDIRNVEREIQRAKLSLHDFLDVYYDIKNRNKWNDMKQYVAKTLLEMFYLCVADIDNLKQDELTDTTFAVLDKLQIIKARLPLLKAAGYDNLHSDVTEKVSHLEKMILNCLYKWALDLLPNLCRQNNLTMKNIMRALQYDVKLFNNVLDQYCADRRNVLTQMFINALTRTAEGNSAPIEYYSGHVKMYVGDILAWVHQNVPIEENNISGILQDCSEEVKEEKISSCLSSITNGICNTLRLRIDNVIARETSPVLLYNILGILQFYLKIMSTMVPNSLLENTLESLCELCESSLWKFVQNTVQCLLLEKMEPPMNDLSPTPGVNSILNFLTEILPIGCFTETKQHNTNCIMKYTLEPLLHILNITASRLSTVDMAVYLLNCFHQLDNALSNYEYIDEWLDRMRMEMESQIDTLTSEQTNYLVVQLNLSPVYSILQNQGKTPLSQLPGMDEQNLKILLNSVGKYAFTPQAYMLPRLRNICCSADRTQILQRSKEVIIAVYKQLYNCVIDPVNQYKNPKRLMPHSPDDLSTKISDNIGKISEMTTIEVTS